MPKQDFYIFSGTSHPALATEIAKELKTKPRAITISKFANGEIYVSIDESVRGREVFIVQTAGDNVNESVMELLVIIDALRRSFAEKIRVIMPNYAYARQDRQAKIREPISARLMANLLKAAGADHLMTIKFHSDQIQGFFDVCDNLSPRKLFAGYFEKKKLKDLVIVSPDVGGAKAAAHFAKKLNNAPIAIFHKSRPAHNIAQVSETIIGDVKGKTILIYDDLIDTAGTVCSARDVLVKQGVDPQKIYLAATHAVFSGPAIERLKKANFKEVVVTNSIPLSKEKQFKGLVVLSVAPMLAAVMSSVIAHRSVGEQYS